jgi:hypothetical protein
MIKLTELWKVLKETAPEQLLSAVEKREDVLREMEIVWESLSRRELATTTRGPVSYGLSLFRGALTWVDKRSEYENHVEHFREGLASNLAFTIQTLVRLEEDEFGMSPDTSLFRNYRKLAEEFEFRTFRSPAQS